MPQEHELPLEFHSSLSLAKSVLGYHTRRDHRLASGGPRSGLSQEEAEEEIKRRLPNLEFKVDQIHGWVASARATTSIAEKMLNRRFDLLSANLTSRINPFSTADSLATASSTFAPLRTGSIGIDPLDLLRALSRHK